MTLVEEVNHWEVVAVWSVYRVVVVYPLLLPLLLRHPVTVQTGDLCELIYHLLFHTYCPVCSFWIDSPFETVLLWMVLCHEVRVVVSFHC